MAETLRAACVQMTSGPDIQENIETVTRLIREAAKRGSTFITTPENTCHLRFPAAQKMVSSLSQEELLERTQFSALAKELGITLLIGSMAVKIGDKILNRSFFFAPDGTLKANYDKIHLFDVQLPSGEVHKESDVMQGGAIAQVAGIVDDFTAGLSICYDLRFAHLFRDLANAGANVLCVPSAFTVPTGQAHWEVLLRARAIETGSFVIAPAQVGEHEGGRTTYGHSIIISPWGKVLAQIEEGEGVIVADLDINDVKTARSAIPALSHDRDYKVQKA